MGTQTSLEKVYREWALRVEPIVSTFADHYRSRVEARGENVPRRGLEFVRRIVDLANAVRRLRSIDDAVALRRAVRLAAHYHLRPAKKLRICSWPIFFG